MLYILYYIDQIENLRTRERGSTTLVNPNYTESTYVR
jgi:hypothetical protein